MKIKVFETSEELGRNAGTLTACTLKKAIEENGGARIILATGASQFETLKALVEQDVDWSKVEMFHLDEYLGLSEDHPASFRKYLRERFTSKVNLKKAHFVKTDGNIQENIRLLTEELRRMPIDVALIGIGENAHMAFNDPPADFDTKEAYITVELDEACKRQQVGEGWFASVDKVPTHALTMTVYQIMQSKVIYSVVPYKVKANAVKLVLENDVTNMIPATMLKRHSDWTLFLDSDSASLVDGAVLERYK